MTVITGTPWDLALNQSAHRAPNNVTAPVNSSRSRTSSGAPAIIPRGRDRSTVSPLSPRAAYQQALHRRARIVDIRTAAERDRYGLVHALPEVAEISQPELVAWLVEHASNIPVALLSQDGAEAAAISRALIDVGLPSALPIQGGFLAWEQAGLPVRSQ
ncbi:MAG TPA: rhodanese-like domain-containing protein [Beutenbergiaceae bacterium]|nr:rhodanese-like domain-containing protein [Beutenbergiaceae bacterium]